MNTKRISAVAIATAIALFFASNVQAVGNDFFNGALRYDLPEVANATGYQLTLAHVDNPNITFVTPDDFVTAWLGIYLDHQPGLYGLKFAQVGLMRRSNGLQWFVYAESGLNYCRGSMFGDKMCRGNPGDIVMSNVWHKVELRRLWVGLVYNWVAYVYDNNGVSYPVAYISNNNTQVYGVFATDEEGYSGSWDPLYAHGFLLNQPHTSAAITPISTGHAAGA